MQIEKNKNSASYLMFLERYDKLKRKDKPIRKLSSKTGTKQFEDFYDIQIQKYTNA
jgi:hypothetical protein